MQVCSTFCSEGFKTCCDWTRAAFSPDGQYVTVGSQDDAIYVWNSSSLKLEKVLKEHRLDICYDFGEVRSATKRDV